MTGLYLADVLVVVVVAAADTTIQWVIIIGRHSSNLVSYGRIPLF